MAPVLRCCAVGLLAAVALLFSVGSAAAEDQVIFKDGFIIIGKHFRERESISDSNGTSVTVPKTRGFDFMECGPKWIIFSNKSQQVAELRENVRGENDYREYRRETGLKGSTPIPIGGRVTRIGDFNANWVRIIHVDLPATKGFADIEQKIERVGPTRIIMPSLNYKWYPYYDPREFDPATVRKMLATHPELAEKPGEPDVAKRLDIAVYMKDAGWLDRALQEIQDAKTAVPGPWDKDITERAEKLTAEIHKAQNALTGAELEKAVAAGKYLRARELIGKFDEKLATGNQAKQFATLKAQVEIVEPRYTKGRRLLRASLDRLAGASNGTCGALGGGLALAIQASARPASHAALLAAGEQVYLDLHPDTTERIDFFLSLAEQAERRVATGQDSGTTPEKLIALAVTGWIKGKNGAEQNVEAALRYWQWRDMLLAYQTEPVLNNRRTFYSNLAGSAGGMTPDEIAQLIGYLPPPQPENLDKRGGTLILPGATPITGIYRRNTGPVTETAKGVDYMVRLPNEYHHGRPARLLLALTNNNVPAEKLVSQLADDADRNGYIIVAPVWVTEYDGAYQFKGDQHYKARAVLRDALKHFRIDNDRVFIFGFLEGASFALDFAASHPDLFAGVAAMGANPKWNAMFEHYWRNCRLLPTYLCFGAIAADTFSNVRRLFEEWMYKGYPALAVAYQGRGQEWFQPEVPIMFDWMEPKKRTLGVGVLKLNNPAALEPWVSIRNADDRFYWVGSDKLNKNNLQETWKGRSFTPAEISADIRTGNQIVINTRGTQNVIIWLDRNMIDWSKPVSVNLNGSAPNGYKPKVLQPDVELMLEQLYQHGDRSLLFLNRLEFATNR